MHYLSHSELRRVLAVTITGLQNLGLEMELRKSFPPAHFSDEMKSRSPKNSPKTIQQAWPKSGLKLRPSDFHVMLLTPTMSWEDGSIQ